MFCAGNCCEQVPENAGKTQTAGKRMDNFQEIVFQISNANGKPRTSKQKMSSEWTLHTQLAAARSGNANVAVRIANDTAAVAVAVAVAVSLGRATHPA